MLAQLSDRTSCDPQNALKRDVRLHLQISNREEQSVIELQQMVMVSSKNMVLRFGTNTFRLLLSLDFFYCECKMDGKRWCNYANEEAVIGINIANFECTLKDVK